MNGTRWTYCSLLGRLLTEDPIVECLTRILSIDKALVMFFLSSTIAMYHCITVSQTESFSAY